MPIGLLVFIVFMIVVLQILQVISKRAGRKSLSTYSDPAEAGKRRKSPSLFSNLQNHGINRVWMQAAGNYELAFIRPGEGGLYPGLGGESGDLLVRAYIDEGDQDSPPSTVIEVKYKEPLPLDLLLMQDDPALLAKAMEGKPRLEKLAGILASSRKNFALTGSDPKALEAFFNPARRQILEELLQTGEKLKMDREGIYWSERGVISEEEFLSEMLGLLIAAGTFFLEGGKELSSAPGRKLAPSPVIPLSTVSKEAVKTPEPLPLAEEKIEEKISPAIELPQVKEEILEVQEVQQEQKKEEILLEEPPSPAVATFPASSESSSGGNDMEEEITLLQLGQDLFAVPFPDAAIKKKWEERKGSLFRGEGIIKASYDYRSDFVFGSAPGVKVTLDLGKIPGKEGRMDLPYRAVISFPAEEKEFFRTAQGKKIFFTGKLLKFETFAKEIYLMEGELTGKEDKV